jgi:hypothetical protein
MDNIKYELEKLTNRKTGYPIATIACYGPDYQFASKVAVGIIFSEEETEVSHLRRCFAKERDDRLDVTINEEFLNTLSHTNRVALRWLIAS